MYMSSEYSVLSGYPIGLFLHFRHRPRQYLAQDSVTPTKLCFSFTNDKEIGELILLDISTLFKYNGNLCIHVFCSR